ncbi:hypothetical protein CDLVIII_0528 [Clostridium sp. DL-VIII]|uniref:hypothetical protein n=1 Tax=Clostridium sp. DL-VIII TaxID=641107 RepID=UPI00023AF4DB|nr:hypothetical protein [Clostridium sp. DL-VIII]EHI97263.1 hypothetical protein CDLVIII_0528 [Clostridium sp. DL-VIII]
MEINFPMLDEYEIKKPSEMALYYSHTELYPFKGVMETVENGLQVYKETFLKMANHAAECGDFYNQSKYLKNVHIYTCKSMPLAYYSLIITLVSMLEDSFNSLCRAYQMMKKYTITYKDIHGQGIERAVLYLELVAGIKGIKNDMQWEYIKTIRDARNMIAHNGGNIDKSQIDKYNKYGFNIDEETNKLFFEYSDVVKIYEVIVDFIDRVFKIEPEVEKSDIY